MEILIILFLILLNGIFSMSEIALVSSRKFKLESEANRGNKNAGKALELANSPNTFLSTVQIGITLIGILTGIFSGKTLTADLTEMIGRISILAPYADSVAIITVVVLITYVTIVFGELIPKRIGLTFPEKISSAVAHPMTVLSAITKPLIWLLGKTNDLFLRIFGINEKQDGIVTEEEINAIIQQSTESGEIQEIEQDIVKRVFSLGDRKAIELMTHRNDLIWLDKTDDLNKIREKADREPHSVYPVCDGSIEQLIGMITLKQLFSRSLDDGFELEQHLHKPIYVPENMAAYRVLEHFKQNKLHHAIVVDEYGSIQGIITMDDVMDELIGDTIEIDSEEYQIIARDENSWLVDGQFPYFELLEYLHIDKEKVSEGFTTVGGLIINKMNHLPRTGEKIYWQGFELEVVDMDGQRIDKILITRK